MSMFGDRLKELRIKRGLTQQEVADTFRLSKSTVAMYERGERNPAFGTLQEMATYFDCSMDYLTGTSDSIQNAPEPQPVPTERLMRLYASLIKKGLTPDQIKTVFDVVNAPDFPERAERGERYSELTPDDLKSGRYKLTINGRPATESEIDQMIGLITLLRGDEPR